MTKYRKWIKAISILSMIAGVICILCKGFLPEYIDSSGYLHEAFFLLPVGFFLIFLGILLFFISRNSATK